MLISATLTNPTWWPIPWLDLESRQPDGLAGGVRRVAWLPGGSRRELSGEWLAATRGVYRIGGFAARGGDWFGLHATRRHFPAALELVVYRSEKSTQPCS